MEQYIKVATKLFNSSWDSPQIISTSLSSSYPSIASNPSGQIIAGWIDLENDTVQVATLTIGGSWSSVDTISSTGGNKGNLQLGIDSSGNGIIAWEEFNTGIISSSQTVGGFETSWSSPQVISNTGINTMPSISVDLGGSAILSWNEITNGEIVAAIYSSSTWSSPTLVSTGYSSNGKAKSLGVNNFVSWIDWDTGAIKNARYVSNTWETAVDLSTDAPNDIPSISGSTNESVTTWTDLSTGEIKVVDYATTGSPSSPLVLSGTDLGLIPEISSSTSLTVVIWESISGSDHLIQVSLN